MIKISENSQYKVDEILYHEKSLRVSNIVGFGSTLCSTIGSFHNFTIDNDQFELKSQTYISWSHNCPVNVEFMDYKVGCDRVLVMKLNDSTIRLAKKACGDLVVAPVDDGSYDNDDYLELLRKGFVLKWRMTSDCSECETSGGHCGFEKKNYQNLCFCSNRPRYTNSCITSHKTSESKSKFGIIFGSGISAAGGVLITAVLLYCFRGKCSSSGIYMMFSRNRRKENEKVEALLKLYGNLAPKRFKYHDIKRMTNHFSCKLGQGGYGHVYKGKLPDNRAVAVKILSNLQRDGEEFLNEVASISRTSHVNIVSLLGFCYEGRRKRALIYEFMPNGSLQDFISNEKSSTVQQLGWQTLHEIALGIARGLEYLHRGCSTRILHLDIKPHNILLDEEFHPKISDFGLAKLCLEKESIISMQDMRGTPGYIAPEVLSRSFGGVSHKSDVYSYGMLILEMVGAKNHTNKEAGVSISEKYFPDWIYDCLERKNDEIEFDGISNEEDIESKRKMIIVGLWCIQTHPSSRPSMKRVLELLEAKLESLQVPPRPSLDVSEEPHKTCSKT